jgi:prevent-host-death family protein
MKTMTATAARRRFGALLKAVQQEPVLVCRRNGDKVVFMSAEQYRRMTGIASFEPGLPKLPRRTKGSSKSP